MIYLHPLGYLLGLEGLALLRAFAGEYDHGFTQARLAETRALLDAADRLGDGAAVAPITISDGYDGWSASYDQPGNGLIHLEQPLVRKLIDKLPVGVALDAACGTGRHTEYLASLGHRVIGVDGSPGMLAKARAKLPDAEFHQADLHQLPVPDDHVDLVVCALALSHVRDLGPVFAEFARVLRPGGSLVTSDFRGLVGLTGFPIVQTGPDGAVGYMDGWHHRTSDYLNAGLAAGLHVRHCEEPRYDDPFVDPDGIPPGETRPAPELVPGTPPDIWSLHGWAAEATNAAYRDQPVAIIWHFQLLSDDPAAVASPLDGHPHD
jgi:SAM-dependent methyltransferase